MALRHRHMPNEFETEGLVVATVRELIYIAGPYSQPDPVENTHNVDSSAIQSR